MKKIYDNYEEVKKMAESTGIYNTIKFLFENVKKNKASLTSADVKNIYDQDYSQFLDCRTIAKTVNGINIYIYSRFIFDYLDKAHDKKGKQVLDFGCGTGELSIALSSIGYQVHGIDYSELSINYANNKKKEKNFDNNPVFECVDFFSLTQKYDYIIFGDVVEHVSMSELNNIIKKAITLLHQRGIIIINTPNGRINPYGDELFWASLSKIYQYTLKFKNKIRHIKPDEFNLKHAYYTQSHINVMYPHQLKTLLKNNGINRIAFYFLQDKNFPLSSLFSYLGISTDMAVIAGVY